MGDGWKPSFIILAVSQSSPEKQRVIEQLPYYSVARVNLDADFERDNLPESVATVHGIADQAAFVPRIRPWTDDYSNLLQILNR